MNLNTLEEMIVVIQAHAAGKRLQYLYNTKTETWEDVIGVPSFAFSTVKYRVKPEVKKIPLTAADIPLDRLVWIHHDKVKYLLTAVASSGLCFASGFVPFSFSDLQNCGSAISFDGGETWQPCEKEVVE